MKPKHSGPAPSKRVIPKSQKAQIERYSRMSGRDAAALYVRDVLRKGFRPWEEPPPDILQALKELRARDPRKVEPSKTIRPVRARRSKIVRKQPRQRDGSPRRAHNRISDEKRDEIVATLCQGYGVAETAKICGADRSTVLKCRRLIPHGTKCQCGRPVGHLGRCDWRMARARERAEAERARAEAGEK